MSSIVYLTNKKNGKVYAYVNEKVLDDSKGGYVYRRRCIGHVDPFSGEIVENRPKSEPPRPRVISCGTDLYLSHISEKCGLTSVLKTAFPEKWGLILSCAMYTISESAPLAMIDSWSRRNVHPSGGEIGVADIVSLLSEIDDDAADAFMRIWNKKASGKSGARAFIGFTEYTDPFAFGTIMDPSRMHALFGELEVVFDRETMVPLGYELHASPSKNLDWKDEDGMLYVVGRAYSSEGSISEALRTNRDFLMIAANDQQYARDIIERGRETILDCSNYYSDPAGRHGFATNMDASLDGRKYLAHLFYSDEDAERDMSSFLSLVDMCRRELDQGDIVASHTVMYSRFFDIRGSVESGRYEIRADKVAEYGSSAGYDVIVTNSVKSSMESLMWILALKNASSFFSGLRNDTDHRVLKLFERHNADSRLFLQFVSFILFSEVLRELKDGNLLREFTVRSAVREMSGIMSVSLPGSRNARMTEADYRQSMLMKNSGIEYRDR